MKPLPTHLIAYDENDEQYIVVTSPGHWIGRVIDPEVESEASIQPLTIGVGNELVVVDIRVISGAAPTDGDLRAAAAWYGRKSAEWEGSDDWQDDAED